MSKNECLQGILSSGFDFCGTKKETAEQPQKPNIPFYKWSET